MQDGKVPLTKQILFFESENIRLLVETTLKGSLLEINLFIAGEATWTLSAHLNFSSQNCEIPSKSKLLKI